VVKYSCFSACTAVYFKQKLLMSISFFLMSVKANYIRNCNYIPMLQHVSTHVNALIQNMNVKKFSLAQMRERFLFDFPESLNFGLALFFP
jgi:hypothetical protein